MAGACAICGSAAIEPFLAREATPVLQNAVYPDTAAAKAVVRGDLDFWRCGACGFMWNAGFSDERLSYAPGYENRQSLSPAFQGHMATRAKAALAMIAARKNAVVVEVGCGQGDFLVSLAGVADRTLSPRLYGFDPAWRGEDGSGPAGARVFRRQFDETQDLDGAPADLIVSRHVIEHVADPIAFLANLRRACGPDTRLAIETPDVDWIVHTGAFHDFFYEHCSLFSLRALDRALARAGFVASRLERVFGEQYLWAEARPVEPSAAETPAAYAHKWARLLSEAARAGPVVIWGAGAKGATFAQIFDPDATHIAAVVDVNPKKQGLRLGGSGHPIVAPDALDAIAPATVLVMNPAYEGEIASFLKSRGWAGRLLILR
jgi:SAM-dependent methyltransferase